MNDIPLFDKNESRLFKKLTTPAKIQDYINTIPFRFNDNEPIIRSPREVIKYNESHCIEGALLASALLAYHGHKPLLLDLKVKKGRDVDHVVALFKERGYWGAISKTNHGVLRYREPIYKTIRELALSYFHEYFLDDGTKTLESYSKPFDLSKYGTEWITSKDDLYEIASDLDDAPHTKIIPPHLKKLRKADKVEIEAGKIKEWK